MKKKFKIFGIIIAVMAIFFIGIVYLSFYTNFWMHYPNPFKTQTALSLLEMSVISDPICHETCFAKRELYRDVISDYALKNKDIKKQIKDSILDKQAYSNFKQEYEIACENSQVCVRTTRVYSDGNTQSYIISVVNMKNITIMPNEQG